MAAQGFQTLLRPSQVIVFFHAGVFELGDQLGVLGGQGLRVVKGLCTNLTHMVHTHEGCGAFFLFSS